MAYINLTGNAPSPGMSGCGPSCSCSRCRQEAATLSEWYVKEGENNLEPGRTGEWSFDQLGQLAPTTATGCPAVTSETVSGFSRYQNSVASLPESEQDKIRSLANLIVRSFQSGCQPIRVIRLIGHADRDWQRGPNFEKKISGDRALNIQKGLITAINNPGISRQITWQLSAAGAGRLAVTNPRTESERMRNRRVEIVLGYSATPPTVTTLTQDIKIVAKSFIAPIGARIGITHCSVSATPKLATLATATDLAYSENPLTDLKDKKYRLYSARMFRVTCRDGKIVSVIPSVLDTDSGTECVPRTTLCLQPPPLITSGVSAGPSGPGTYDFSWLARGRPHLAAEPAFQIVCPRTSVYIWHRVTGQIDCSGPTIKVAVTIVGSHFPSHRVFVNGVNRTTIPQGVFSNLWVPASLTSPSMVR